MRIVLVRSEIIAGKKKPLIFNPYAAVEQQISAASSTLAGMFSEIDSALDKGKTIKQAVHGTKIEAVMHRAIASSRLSGFMHGAKYSGKNMPSNYGRDIGAFAEKRAAFVGRSVRRTTRRTLRTVPDSEFVLSRDRALSAARFEAARSYFKGVNDSFRGTTGWGKGWATAEGDSCEECLANEDMGLIAMSDTFASGDVFPPLHLLCNCMVTVEKMG